jgi:hypothetical protein
MDKLHIAYSWCSHQPKQLNASSKMNNRNLRVFIIFNLMQGVIFLYQKGW